MRLMGLAASTGHTHLLSPSALPEAGFGFPAGPHPKRAESMVTSRSPSATCLVFSGPSALRTGFRPQAPRVARARGRFQRLRERSLEDHDEAGSHTATQPATKRRSRFGGSTGGNNLGRQA
jgi:hypothetical protein